MINHLTLNRHSMSILTALLCSACGDPSTSSAPAPAHRDEAPRAEVSPAGRADSSEANAAPVSGSKLCEESAGVACDDEDPREDSCRSTELVGVACAPSGEPVFGAEVTVQLQTCSGELQTFQTVTGSDGRYSFTGLSGAGALQIRAGVFEGLFELELGGAERLELTAGQTCLSPQAARLAVITGAHDSIESSISLLGFDYDAYCGGVSSVGARSLLGDPERLSQYDALFINSGSKVDFSSRYSGAERVNNLRGFVEAGGSLYVSNAAAVALQGALPEVFSLGYERDGLQSIPECCSCGAECELSCGAQVDAESVDYNGSVCMGAMPGRDFGCEVAVGEVYGYGPSGLEFATVLNERLRQAVGQGELEVFFERDEWIQLNPNPELETLVESGLPLMARYHHPSGGRVIYTSFHSAPSDDQALGSDLERLFKALIFEL